MLWKSGNATQFIKLRLSGNCLVRLMQSCAWIPQRTEGQGGDAFEVGVDESFAP